MAHYNQAEQLVRQRKTKQRVRGERFRLRQQDGGQGKGAQRSVDDGYSKVTNQGTSLLQ